MTMRLPHGYVHVYYGPGKGKTSAAFGLALRAAGAGARVRVVQFLKGGAPRTGELLSARCVPRLTCSQVPQVHPCFSTAPVSRADLGRSTRRAFLDIRAAMARHAADVFVLDEILNVWALGACSQRDLIALVRTRPADVELVLTGRTAFPELLRRADYVTYLREVKHPYRRGIQARRGIEW